jgi:hypothetical protein
MSTSSFDLSPNVNVVYEFGVIKAKLSSSEEVLQTFTILDGRRYLINITNINETASTGILRISSGEFSEDVVYRVTLDERIYGVDGSVTFGKFTVPLAPDERVWGMQGIGISDITDVKPNGSPDNRSLIQTFSLIESDAIQIERQDGCLEVRLLHRENILHIRIA